MTQARFASDEYTIKRGNIRSTRRTDDRYLQRRHKLWKSNAASGGTPRMGVHDGRNSRNLERDGEPRLMNLIPIQPQPHL